MARHDHARNRHRPPGDGHRLTRGITRSLPDPTAVV